MGVIEQHIHSRVLNQKYTKKLFNSSLTQYLHREHWIDTVIDEHLVYSHRQNKYTKDTFTEKLHFHECYELLIYIRGDVEYIVEEKRITPSSPIVVWFEPGKMHTGKLLSPSNYERYVFYFSSDFFRLNNKKTPILNFIKNNTGAFLKPSQEKSDKLLKILHEMDATLNSGKKYSELLLKSLVVELFDKFDSLEESVQTGHELNDSIAEVKRYIDAEYKNISSIADIAEQFYYSREHLSRKFRETYNISIAQYLTRRRVTESLSLLKTMSVADAAYAVGFHSQSAFITAFKKTMHLLPSEYKAQHK